MRKLSLIVAVACSGLAACGDETARSAPGGPGAVSPIVQMLPPPAQTASHAEITATAPMVVAPGKVYVAPVSTAASAPGIDPMNAATLPPMPAPARTSAQLSKK